MVENEPATTTELEALQALFKRGAGKTLAYIKVPATVQPACPIKARARLKRDLQTQTIELKSILSQFNQTLEGQHFNSAKAMALLNRASVELNNIITRTTGL